MRVPNVFSLHKQKSRTWICHMRNFCAAGFTQNSSSALPVHILNASQTKCKQNSSPTPLKRLLNKRTGSRKVNSCVHNLLFPNAPPTPLKQKSSASPRPSRAPLTPPSRKSNTLPPPNVPATFLRRGDVPVPAQRKLQEMRCTEREMLHADGSC